MGRERRVLILCWESAWCLKLICQRWRSYNGERSLVWNVAGRGALYSLGRSGRNRFWETQHFCFLTLCSGNDHRVQDEGELGKQKEWLFWGKGPMGQSKHHLSVLYFPVISRIKPLSPSTVQPPPCLTGGVGSFPASSPPASFLSSKQLSQGLCITIWSYPSSAEAPQWLPESLCQSAKHLCRRTSLFSKMSQTHSFTKCNKNELTEMQSQQENKGIQSARAFMSPDSTEIKNL